MRGGSAGRGRRQFDGQWQGRRGGADLNHRTGVGLREHKAVTWLVLVDEERDGLGAYAAARVCLSWRRSPLAR